MIGTLFLFMYWPSFNGVLAVGMAQQRACINTYLSISVSVLAATFVSRAALGKIDMEVLLNATLAGGVIMGAACDLITGPGGVQFLHGIPGTLGGFTSAIVVASATYNFQNQLQISDQLPGVKLYGRTVQ